MHVPHILQTEQVFINYFDDAIPLAPNIVNTV